MHCFVVLDCTSCHNYKHVAIHSPYMNEFPLSHLCKLAVSEDSYNIVEVQSV